MVQGATPHLKDSLLVDDTGKRNGILHLMVHLYNFHIAVVGINQIMNSFTEKNAYFCNQQIEPTANRMLPTLS